MLLDNLENWSYMKSQNADLDEYEYFECSFCNALCRMPMAIYKQYNEQDVMTAKFRCVGCYKKMQKNEKVAALTVEQLEVWWAQGLTLEQVKNKLECSQPLLYRKMQNLGFRKSFTLNPNKNTNKDTVRIQADNQSDNQPLTIEPNVELDKNHFPEVSNMVDHPPHYTAGGVECIDAIMAAVEGLTPQEAVCVANVIKYTWRFKRKNGKQDLQKAEWYLKRLSELQS